jgi:ABC-type amino acid transport substrate-binding protein
MGGESGLSRVVGNRAWRDPGRPALRWLVFGLLSASLALLACGDSGSNTSPADPTTPTAAVDSLHTGDLGRIRREGALRILALRAPEAYLPRSGSPLDVERSRAAALAAELGVEARVVFVDALDELIPALIDGRGDLIADNFTVTEERRQHVAFSAPVASSRDQVVVRADDPVRKPADLAGRRIAEEHFALVGYDDDAVGAGVEEICVAAQGFEPLLSFVVAFA